LQAFGVDLFYCGSVKADVPFRHFSGVIELAQACDILILSCKGGSDTHHLVNAQVLQALGPEGYLVNVARGTVVDESALLAALRTGGIRAAALDVFEDEPLQDSALVSLPNALLSPHAGTATKETRAQMLRLTLDNLHAVLCGRPALTPVPAAARVSAA